MSSADSVVAASGRVLERAPPGVAPRGGRCRPRADGRASGSTCSPSRARRGSRRPCARRRGTLPAPRPRRAGRPEARGTRGRTRPARRGRRARPAQSRRRARRARRGPRPRDARGACAWTRSRAGRATVPRRGASAIITACSPRAVIGSTFAPSEPIRRHERTSTAIEPTCRTDEQAATRPATRRCGKEHQMRRGFALFGLLAAVAIAAVAAMLTGQGPSSARASSHSEAPLISQDPRADNTDLYAFVDPNDTSTVDDRRELHPARSPGQRAELPELRRRRSLRDQDRQQRGRHGRHRLPVRVHDRDAEPGHVPLQHRADQVAERPELEPAADLHASRSSTSRRTGRSRRAARTGRSCWRTDIPTPPDNIGPRSTPNYDALAAAAVTSLPGGGKVFAGQRDDPFFVDLGSIFDLGGPAAVQPVAPDPARCGAGRGRVDELQHALDRDPGADHGRREGPEHE